MAFNLERAMSATSMAGSSSQGRCAKFVRQYIEAGGVSTAGRPDFAWAYRNYLPKIGWSYLTQLNGLAAQMQFSRTAVQPGDISVMDHGQYGHICIWNGRAWVSDFIQRNMWPYKGQGTCYIFRFTGKISKGFNFNTAKPEEPFNYEPIAKQTEELTKVLKMSPEILDEL